MTSTFPFFEVLSYETGSPVKIVVWHVRSVRPIREMVDDNEVVTRIEFTNGDVLDATDSVQEVIGRISNAVAPVNEGARAKTRATPGRQESAFVEVNSTVQIR